MTSLAEKSQGRVDGLTRVLRAAGAVLLLSSASSFLLQRWDSVSDSLRYGSLLAHVVLLAVAGLVCGSKRFRESRSARTFLLLSLSMIPAAFEVLGGLVYSVFSLDGAEVALPGFARWVASGPTEALLTAGISLAICASVSRLALTALVRPVAGRAAAGLVAMCSLLLVPVRSADWIGLLLLFALGVVVLVESRVFSQHAAARTFEGRLVRLITWSPILLVAGRAIGFYEPSGLFFGCVQLGFGGLLLLGGRRLKKDEAGAILAEIAGAFIASTAWVPMAIALDGALLELDGHPLWLLPVALGLLAASRAARSTRRALQSVGAVVGVSTVGVALLVEPSMLSAVIALLVGLAAGADGLLRGERWLVGWAGCGVLGGLVVGVTQAIDVASLWNWGSLSALGMGLVFVAAWVERRRPELVQQVARMSPEGRKAVAEQRAKPEPSRARIERPSQVGVSAPAVQLPAAPDGGAWKPAPQAR